MKSLVVAQVKGSRAQLPVCDSESSLARLKSSNTRLQGAAPKLGLAEELGLILALGLTLRLALAEGETEADGETERLTLALGERLAEGEGLKPVGVPPPKSSKREVESRFSRPM